MTLPQPSEKPEWEDEGVRFIKEDDEGKAAEGLDHAREMPAAVRRSTRDATDAAINVQPPNPNEASLELGHLQRLVRPLMILIRDRDAAPGKAVRPLHKLAIVSAKTKPKVGDEQYLINDIKEIKAFMETSRYEPLADAVKQSIAAYLSEQEEMLEYLSSIDTDANADRTDVIRLEKHPAQAPTKSRLKKLLSFLGIN